MTSGRNQTDQTLNLIERVYDASLDERLWRGVAKDIAALLGSPSSVVLSQSNDKTAYLSRTPNITDQSVEKHRAHYQANVWIERGAHYALGTTIASKEFVSDAEFERTDFCQDYCRDIGVFHMVGSVFPIADGETGVLGVHRARGDGRYSENDKRLIGKFLPHLQRALQIRRKLYEPAIERQAALDALDRVMTATIVIDRDRRILFANRHGETLLAAQDGIRAFNGRVAVASRAVSERLIGLIQGAIDTSAGNVGSAGGAVSLPRIGRLPLTILVAPFRQAREGFGSPEPAAILFLRDPEQPTLAMAALQGLFGLTPSEASVASALADGKSLEDVAVTHGVSLNTTRTHLKNILAKTGTNRQAQLVSVLLRSLPR